MSKVKAAAEALGCTVQQGKLKFRSSYAGAVDAEMIITGKNGGQCAIVKSQTEGEYTTIIDNYSNQIVSQVGRDCSTLTRDYTTEMAKSQALLMGGIINSQKVNDEGWVELRVGIQ